jgi:hypothetical protein
MVIFEPRLKSLAMQLGIPFRADGNPGALFDLNTDLQDTRAMAMAMLIELSLRLEDIDLKRKELKEAAKNIEGLSQLLGENDRRVKILRAMHAEANAIIEGSQAPDVV